MHKKKRDIYKLRWRFDFINKQPVYGLWNNPGPEHHKAKYVSKNGMLFARIEGKHIYTYHTKVFAECSGQEYVNFKWEHVGRIGIGKLAAPVYGLSIVDKKNITTVDIFGNITVKDYNGYYDQIKLSEYKY